MKQRALNYLRSAINNPEAIFHEGQWESIEELLIRKRILVVQRTDWGKSMVYFLATKLWREQGVDPSLFILPLLSFMRNQLEEAERIGITARTINSTNDNEWNQIQRELNNDKIDRYIYFFP